VIDIFPQYLEHLRQFTTGIEKGMKFVVDCGNGVAGKYVEEIFKLFEADFTGMYLEPDGRFPNHEANPLKPENVAELRQKVKEQQVQMGVAYDGDGDRIAFIDEKGEAIPSDILGALMARYVLRDEPGAVIIYDLRSSKVVKEEIEANGGKPLESRVGHSFIKALMREHNSPFAAELSGHYYFKDNYYTDCGDLALLLLLRILSKEDKPLSELIAPLKRYVHSGEINFEVEDKESALEKLQETFSDAGEKHALDGVTVRYDDWWFNVRPSNTEPLLRLNLEAIDEDHMQNGVAKVKEVLSAFES
jgi:phosphomannomutase